MYEKGLLHNKNKLKRLHISVEECTRITREHLVVNTTDRHFGVTVSFSCEEDYILAGARYLTCTQYGEGFGWSDFWPVCIKGKNIYFKGEQIELSTKTVNLSEIKHLFFKLYVFDTVVNPIQFSRYGLFCPHHTLKCC